MLDITARDARLDSVSHDWCSADGRGVQGDGAPHHSFDLDTLHVALGSFGVLFEYVLNEISFDDILC